MIKKSGIRGKFIGISCLFILLVLSGYFSSHFLIEDKRLDEHFISMATRQQVLVQSYVKNFFYFMETGQIENVTTVVKEFEANQKILIAAKEDTSEVEHAIVQPDFSRLLAEDEDTKNRLGQVTVKWNGLKDLAISLLGVTGDKKKEGYLNLITASSVLNDELNTLIEASKIRSNSNFNKINSTQILVLALSTFVVMLSVYLLSRFVISVAVKRFEQISEEANSIRSALDEIEVKNSLMGDSGKRLSESVNETMSAVTEITQIVQKSTELTDSASNSAKDCLEKAKEGNRSISIVRDSLRQISTQNTDLMETIEMGNKEIRGILDEVKKIEEQTRVINDIVFQTKLLSFNASVEAARAGESGKGFSVVAEEIGKLAKVSGESSLEIASLLSKSITNIEAIIQNNSHRLNGSAKRTSESISKTVEYGDICGSSLEDISKEVHKMQSVVSLVSESSNEQLEGIRNIESAMLDITTSNREHHESVEVILNLTQGSVSSSRVLMGFLRQFRSILLGDDSKVAKVTSEELRSQVQVTKEVGHPGPDDFFDDLDNAA